MNMIWTLCVAAGASVTSSADVDSLHARALEQFEAQQYDSAIATMEQALDYESGRALTEFYLGKFKHYRCHDSVPSSGCSRAGSGEILDHFLVATELDPSLGDAYYFIGAEFGARALAQLQAGDLPGFIEELRSGRAAGGYPDWMVESARNTLRSCPRNAILFVGGDPEANPIYYVQFVEGTRQDVSVLPAALLDRPWFARHIKTGVVDGPRGVPMSWTQSQIDAMRPYKWSTTTVRCHLASEVAAHWGLDAPVVEWAIAPDLGRGSRPGLLSASRALMTDILLSNGWKRPVFRSLGSPQGLWPDLASHEQQHGFAIQLLPHAAELPLDEQDSAPLLLDPASFAEMHTYAARPMPRAKSLIENYYVSLVKLAYARLASGDNDGARAALEQLDALLQQNVLPVPDHVGPMVTALRSQVSGAPD